MLIKDKDDKSKEIQYLELLTDSSEDPELQDSLKKDLYRLKSGLKGEKNSAYYLDYYFRDSKDWALIHDLRIEYKGDVAQIDHLLIGRCLDIYVIESKNFNSGIKITEEGEFYSFYNKKPYAVPSPIEQNNRHIHLLSRYLENSDLLPKRIGLKLKPNFTNVVLVSPNSRITRPNKDSLDTSMVIKADMFNKKFEEDVDSPVSIKYLANMAKTIFPQTLREFSKNLSNRHKPVSVDYIAKYGIKGADAIKKENDSDMETENNKVSDPKGHYQYSKSKYFCANCKSGISEKVAKFCFNNKSRFEGRAYCIDCQKNYSRNGKPIGSDSIEK